ncbi:MAG: hypothetical protein QXZ06_07410, partial [Candidatus Jordarchaeales archaeon]
FSKYLDESGKVKWGTLEEDRIILRFEVQDEESGKTVSRMMLLRDPEGKSIRVRLGGEFGYKMVVLSDFALKSFGELGPGDAVSYFKELGLTGKVLDKAIENYYKTLPFTEEDVEYALKAGLIGLDQKGRIGERLVIERIAKQDPTIIEDIRYRDGKEIDIVLKKSLVSVKYWDEETVKLHMRDDKIFEGDIKDLMDYKKAMVEMGKDKVYLVFVEKINQELFDEMVRKIIGVLGEDASSWLKPVNGYKNLEIKGG